MAADAATASGEELQLSDNEWRQLREAASQGVRAAFLQRTFGVTYERAAEVIANAARLGLLDIRGRSAFTAEPMCHACYTSRRERQSDGIRSNGRDPIPAQLRFRVLQRDAFRCQYCGRSARDGATLHIDHIVPVAVGGSTSDDNLIAACEQCNLGKSDQQLLPPAATSSSAPSDEPVLGG